ncbi:OmpA family protein [uncultured Paracoccus sp.]|uniref:OmpA family protein n=1 Tax=uncultured Paracoccus sp. TaxID=189685 RepID=UPI002619AA1C|nr:OmpA family protein [uncultured Paracoccus sp.]
MRRIFTNSTAIALGLALWLPHGAAAQTAPVEPVASAEADQAAAERAAEMPNLQTALQRELDQGLTAEALVCPMNIPQPCPSDIRFTPEGVAVQVSQDGAIFLAQKVMQTHQADAEGNLTPDPDAVLMQAAPAGQQDVAADPASDQEAGEETVVMAAADAPAEAEAPAELPPPDATAGEADADTDAAAADAGAAAEADAEAEAEAADAPAADAPAAEEPVADATAPGTPAPDAAAPDAPTETTAADEAAADEAEADAAAAEPPAPEVVEAEPADSAAPDAPAQEAAPAPAQAADEPTDEPTAEVAADDAGTAPPAEAEAAPAPEPATQAATSEAASTPADEPAPESAEAQVTEESPEPDLPDAAALERALAQEVEGQAADAPAEATEAQAAADATAEGVSATADAADAETPPADAAAADTDAPTEQETTAAPATPEAAEAPAQAADAQAEAVAVPEAQAPETEAAREAAAGSAPVTAAALDPDAQETGEVVETQVTEENARSSTEDFATSIAEAARAAAAGAAAGALAGQQTGQQAQAPADAAAQADATAQTPGVAPATAQDLQEELAAREDDDDRDDVARAALAGLAGLVVGQMLSNDREVALTTGDRVVVTRPDGSQEVLKNDNALLMQPGSNVQTENFADGSSRSTVVRQDGSTVVTIRDADLRVLRRTVIAPDGTSTTLIDETVQVQPVNVSELPPPARPLVASDRPLSEEDLRAALQREVAVDRRFTLSQIRNIPAVRALVAPIDINSITFDTGSAAIKPDQAQQLATLGRAIAETIRQNPREVFMIEGYTDTVGSDASNLALSDRRAESVALALTEYFQVPPENMVVQGYGEQFLRVPAEGDVRANRRASVRRITELLAQN